MSPIRLEGSQSMKISDVIETDRERSSSVRWTQSNQRNFISGDDSRTSIEGEMHSYAFQKKRDAIIVWRTRERVEGEEECFDSCSTKDGRRAKVLTMEGEGSFECFFVRIDAKSFFSLCSMVADFSFHRTDLVIHLEQIMDNFCRKIL